MVAFGIGSAFLTASGAENVPLGIRIALSLTAVVILIFALFYFARHILVARVRDTGLHTAFALLIFIPLLNFLFLLALLFIPTDKFKR